MKTSQLIKIMTLFRELEEDIPIGTILCFLHLCEQDGATVSQVNHRFKLGKSRASRNMRNLTDLARPGKAGIDVAYAVPTNEDRRVFTFHLNEKGRAVKERLYSLL